MRAWRNVVATAMVMALALPLISSLSGCGSMQAEGDGSPPPFSTLPDLQQVGLEQKWQRHLQLRGAEEIQHAWRVGKSVYVTTNRCRIFRIDSTTGVQAFSQALSTEAFEIFRPTELQLSPSSPKNEVLVCTRAMAYVLDKGTGALLRSSALPVSLSCTPTAVGNTMCIGGANQFIGLYLDRLGVVKWRTTMEQQDLFLSTPVVIDNNVIVASKNGRVSRLGAPAGDWDWKDRKPNGEVLGGLAADGRAVYVPSMDQRVYAFNVNDGTELWQSPVRGILNHTPALGGSVVMVPSTGEGLFAISRKDGAERWFARGVMSVATVTDDHVWVGDDAGNLKSLSLETGEELASARVEDVRIFVRNSDDDQVILVARSGAVAAYQPAKKAGSLGE